MKDADSERQIVVDTGSGRLMPDPPSGAPRGLWFGGARGRWAAVYAEPGTDRRMFVAPGVPARPTEGMTATFHVCVLKYTWMTVRDGSFRYRLSRYETKSSWLDLTDITWDELDSFSTYTLGVAAGWVSSDEDLDWWLESQAERA